MPTITWTSIFLVAWKTCIAGSTATIWLGRLVRVGPFYCPLLQRVVIAQGNWVKKKISEKVGWGSSHQGPRKCCSAICTEYRFSQCRNSGTEEGRNLLWYLHWRQEEASKFLHSGSLYQSKYPKESILKFWPITGTTYDLHAMTKV